MERRGDASGEAARNVNAGVAARARRRFRGHAYTRVQRGWHETGVLPKPLPDDAMDNPLATLPDRAMRVAHHVGDGLRDAVPDRALKWVETGAAMAALKTGGRVAVGVVRRNPAIAATAVAGAGLLWLAARHRRKGMQEEEASGNGKAKRVHARKATRSRKQTAAE